ncbi:MAG: F0F1 ATP synthase subunit epsilon [Acidobacteria bacterium]|nr:MAG: F0F1 ATP synthase subunit epsilon [Acidobacteriota bacterium]PYV21334.1 MAG: F0F1 ATP synthase subunit epsilon [Acidobacteriota bacterium]
MPTRIELELVTPERPVVRGPVISVSLPGKEGYLGILPGHAPLLSELKPGELSYTQDGATHYVAVSWGFAEVLPDRVIVLVHTSERAEEIDRERAQRARQRAEERLGKTSDTEIDRERAQAALERAMARLEAAGKTSSAQQSNRL